MGWRPVVLTCCLLVTSWYLSHAPAVEAVVKMRGDDPITLHFTNEHVTWSKAYKLEKDGTKVKDLPGLIEALRVAYPGQWKAKFRAQSDLSVLVELK